MAKELVLVISGRHKADIAKCVIEGEIDEMIPASILKLHPQLTIIMDKDSAARLDKETLDLYR